MKNAKWDTLSGKTTFPRMWLQLEQENLLLS